MKKESAVSRLRALDSEIVLLSHIQSTLEWDMETGLPAKGISERSEALSYISGIIHEKATSPELGEILSEVSACELSDADKALLRIRKKVYQEESGTPSDLVNALAAAKGKAHGAWVRAREENSWSLFQPSLESLVALTKEKASCMKPDVQPYDTMLSFYEEGMAVAVLDPLFEGLVEGIHSLMGDLSSVTVDDSFLFCGYDGDAMRAFCHEVLSFMGFDWSRGRTGESPHPFTITLGSDDIRITNRFSDAGLFDPIGSALHEGGHALYEMHASLPNWARGTSLAAAASMGVHESQSRFWENIIGRSASFWTGMYPILRKYIPSLASVSLVDFVKAINRSRSSAIRVNADELTYSLHIAIRYEIEKAMFSASVPFSSLPELWNELSRKILFYTPKNNSEGILQDCHWAGGDFGYFPSYTVGNIYASQFYMAIVDDLGEDAFNEALVSRDYAPIRTWLDGNIWSCGALYEGSELVKRVTGSAIDVSCYISYLCNKFRELYL